MKKHILIAALMAMTASTYGQGYMTFAASKNATWDNFTTPGTAVVSSGTVNVGFIWAASGTSAITAAAGGGNPTNDVSGAQVPPGVWNLILNDPNFHFGVNGNTSAIAVQPSNTASLSRGGWGYNGGAGFPVTGAPVGPIQVVAIAWSSAYATPALAAAANSPVGWSAQFTYTTGASGSDPNGTITFSGNGMTPFGISPIPEPSTFALAGLGAAALLLFRRKK